MATKHRVFLSFRFEDESYKDTILKINKNYNIFEDFSVGNGDINDFNKTNEEVRKEIRDKYIKDASVLILLNGKNMRQSNFVDWEIHAAMYDGEVNKKIGILVINLPEVNDGMVIYPQEIKNIVDKLEGSISWSSLTNDYNKILLQRPNTPKRILKNIIKSDVKINIINWDIFLNMTLNEIMKLIDIAFNDRKNNKYDTSDKLKGRRI